jgi:Polyketide cyclase / dehydrase and lipid transport
MGRAHVRAQGAVPPERFVAALTDFGPGRNEIWGNSDPAHLVVHDRGETSAEVTEGSSAGGGVWQRLRYDWSTPGLVTLDVLDGNAFGPGGSWTYRLEPDGTGGTVVDLTVVRVPCSAKGRILDVLLSLGGSGWFARDLRRSLRRLESRQSSPS